MNSMTTINFANKNDSIFAVICIYKEVTLRLTITISFLIILNLKALNFDCVAMSNDST